MLNGTDATTADFLERHNYTENQSADDSVGVTVFLGCFVVLFSVLTTVTNVLLVTVIVRTPTLHTKTNAMIISVGVSEFLVGVFIMPIKSISLFYPLRRLSKELCQFVEFMTSLVASSKSLGMLSLSIDRCIAVSHPLQYASCINKSTTSLFLVCVWGIGILFAVLPLFGVGHYSHLTMERNCDPFFPHKSVVFPIIFEVSNTLVPSMIIVINFIIIIVEARSHHRIITIAQLAIAMYSGPAAARGINYSRSTFKAMRTYLIICTVYLCACFPKSVYTVAVLIDADTYYTSTFTALTMLFYVCCTSTPLVITTLNGKFKQSIKTLVTRKNKVKPDAEPFTITTGLQSILETSMVFNYGAKKDSIKSARDKARPGPSFQPTVTFAKRKISILHEVHSSSSSDVLTGSKSVHIQLRKSLSSPL